MSSLFSYSLMLILITMKKLFHNRLSFYKTDSTNNYINSVGYERNFNLIFMFSFSFFIPMKSSHVFFLFSVTQVLSSFQVTCIKSTSIVTSNSPYIIQQTSEHVCVDYQRCMFGYFNLI